jgi:tetratricopeptide (TPR) repeat protein
MKNASSSQARALPAAPRPVGVAAGDSASPEALNRISRAVQELKAYTVLPLLRRAVTEIQADNFAAGADLVIKALEIDERCGLGWHLLAICREKANDFTSALRCYESALQLSPDDVDIAHDLGRLAHMMGMKEEAEKLFAHCLVQKPGWPDAANNLASALRDQMRFDDAVEVLRPIIYANPESAMLWNTLGTVMIEQGEMDQAMIFLNQALEVDPSQAKAQYNRGNTRLALGDVDGALADCEAALPKVKVEGERMMMRLARAAMLIAKGRLSDGWDEYEARLDPQFVDVTHFITDRPAWTPDVDLMGKHLLVIGEQGLGDEVMFANLLPDLVEAVGPEGALSIAVEQRLIPLFQRSFPSAQVGRHDTYKVDHMTARIVKWSEADPTVDYWTPLASPLRRFRRDVAAFPQRERFLIPDPARVEHWRGVLAELGPEPKVGAIWKSLVLNSGRYRNFSPFDQWASVLSTPGVRFVNLQYGDAAAELEQARQRFGVEIWNPPGIDLKDDLDDVAALTCALDLTIGPANATINIAAACGAPVWLVSTPGAWPRLGTDRYPWYPQVRVFSPSSYTDWAPVMAEVGEALSKAF